MKKKSSLTRKMIIYFALIVAVTLFMTGEFWLQFRVEKVTGDILKQANVTRECVKNPPLPAIRIVRYWRNKITLLLAILVVVVAMVFIMFVKNLIGPLNHMVKVAHQIAAGDLRQTINVTSRDELAKVGELINDLTTNIQEIIANTLLYCDDIGKSVHKARTLLEDESIECDETKIREARKRFGNAEESIAQLRGLLSEFSLYEIKPRGEQRE